VSAPPPAAAPPGATTEADKDSALPPSSKPAVTASTQTAAPAPATRRDELKKLARLEPPLQERSTFENKLQGPTAKKDVGAELAFETSAPRPQSTTESVEVTAGAVAPVTSAQAPGTDGLTANEAAPVMRAKAARVMEAPVGLAKTATAKTKQAEVEQAEQKGENAEVSNALSAASSDMRQMPLQGRNVYEKAQLPQVMPQWRVRSDEVERSLDSGAHWKIVFEPHRALLTVAAGNSDVWAGGKAGVLYHSANSGLTWTQVQPAVHGQALDADIVHIDVSSSAKIVLSTSNNQTWDTSDGGATWEKK